MLSFLSPLYLLGAAAAILPVVLHLLKREPEPRLKFAPVRLLKNAPVEHTERRRLREWLLLALRVAALVLLALAFARPFFASGPAVGSTDATIVALDRSMSLSAPGLLARAQQLALDAIDGAPPERLVGLVTFDDDAAIVVRPTTDRSEVRAAIRAVTPGYGGTRYRAALSAAVQALDGRAGTIVVVTDLQATGWGNDDRAEVPDAVGVDVKDVGAVPPNLAVTDLAVDHGRLLATVRNTGDAARNTTVRLSLDGTDRGSVRIALGADAASQAVFDLPTDASTAVVTVADPDGVAADNTRYRVLATTPGLDVVLLTANGTPDRDAFYVRQALVASTPGSAPFHVVGVSGAAIADWDATRLDRVAAVIVLSTRGLKPGGRQRLASYARGGGGLLVAAGPELDGDVIADALGTRAPVALAPVAPASQQARSLAPVDVRHPIFRPFGSGAGTLGLVTFRRIARINGDGCHVLAEFTSGEPALVECVAGQGRVLIFASDLGNAWNDFPRRATFVPFVHEVVRYLGAGTTAGESFLVATVPPGVPPEPGIVDWPDGSTSAGRSRRVAVNVDPRESNADRLAAGDFMANIVAVPAAPAQAASAEGREQEESQRLWQYAFVLALLVLAVESFVAAHAA